MSTVKITSLITILILVVVFTLQNTEQVEITFLLWHISLSRALMLFLVFTLGLLTGFVLHMLQHEAKANSKDKLLSN